MNEVQLVVELGRNTFDRPEEEINPGRERVLLLDEACKSIRTGGGVLVSIRSG